MYNGLTIYYVFIVLFYVSWFVAALIPIQKYLF